MRRPDHPQPHSRKIRGYSIARKSWTGGYKCVKFPINKMQQFDSLLVRWTNVIADREVVGNVLLSRSFLNCRKRGNKLLEELQLSYVSRIRGFSLVFRGKWWGGPDICYHKLNKNTIVVGGECLSCAFQKKEYFCFCSSLLTFAETDYVPFLSSALTLLILSRHRYQIRKKILAYRNSISLMIENV